MCRSARIVSVFARHARAKSAQEGRPSSSSFMYATISMRVHQMYRQKMYDICKIKDELFN